MSHIRNILEAGYATIDVKAEGRCPCGKPIKVGYTQGVPTVIHVAPTCKDFDRIENPIDYLAWVNRTLGAN